MVVYAGIRLDVNVQLVTFCPKDDESCILLFNGTIIENRSIVMIR